MSDEYRIRKAFTDKIEALVLARTKNIGWSFSYEKRTHEVTQIMATAKADIYGTETDLHTAVDIGPMDISLEESGVSAIANFIVRQTIYAFSQMAWGRAGTE